MKSLLHIVLFALSCVVLLFSCVDASSSDPNKDAKPLPILPPLTDHVHDYTFSYTGGAPFCTQCGSAGSYACSNQPVWIPSQFYVDDIHNGQVAIGVEAILTGSYGCTSTTTTVVEVLLNNITIDVLNLNGNQQCKCNTCDGKVSFKKSTPFGWPNYFYTGAGKNNATIVVHTGSICLNSLMIRVTYGQPAYPLKTKAFRANWSGPRSIPNGVCGRSAADYSSGSLSFVDPLPSGNLLYSVDVVIFGTWFAPSSGSTCSNATNSIALNGLSIGSSQTMLYPRHYNDHNIVTSPCHTYGCDGQWMFSLNQLYQNGVPSYVYGGTNILRFTASSTPNMAFAVVYLYYYNR